MLQQTSFRTRLRLGGALTAIAFLTACGGGGGGGGAISTPSPQPAPSPTPTPLPAPSPTPSPTAAPTPPATFDTAEFRRSDGPAQHNAVSAWSEGWNGSGVTIAVVDTGIDVDSPEFAGRLSSASRDLYDQTDTRGLDAEDDHGTNVALVAAGARNGTGVLGMAWGSTVMALRTDEPGSCATEDPEDESTGCNFADSYIAGAVRHATANGAKVINLSLGGSTPTQALREAVAAAASAGILVVVSAGNDGNDVPDAFATGLETAGRDSVIIVGSVDENGTVSEFSNRAGTADHNYISARGESICCTYQDGSLYIDNEGYVYLFSGTSFSAPQVAGAAALLAQAFPSLTGVEIIDILLESARDAGAAGRDDVYGSGILDIAAAFRPIGTTSLAGSTLTMALGDSTGATSPAMGDAVKAASLQTVVLDKYRRAFDADIAGTLESARLPDKLHGAIGTQRRHSSLATASASVAFTIDAGGRVNEIPHVGQLRLTSEDAEQARVLAARVALKVAPDMQFGLAYSESADGLVAQLQGQDRPAFMIAQQAGSDDGMVRSSDAAMALRKQFGEWGLTLSAEQGETFAAAPVQREQFVLRQRPRDAVRSFGLGMDRSFGDLDAAFGLELVQEERTMLGARFHDALGMQGAETLFADAEAGWNLADQWRLGLAMRGGITTARAAGTVAAGSQLYSSAWSLDLSRRGVFAAHDALGLRISQPLRVESGGLDLRLPVAFDYATLRPEYGLRSLSLTPQGREIMGELAWRGALFNGSAAASLYYRKDPGHYASLPDDKGAAFQWSRKF